MKIIEPLIGQPVAAWCGLTATCIRPRCRAELRTEGGEVATIVRAQRFNGKFTAPTGWAALRIRCPCCDAPADFHTRIWLATATLADFTRRT